MFGMMALLAGVVGVSAFVLTDPSPEEDDETGTHEDDAAIDPDEAVGIIEIPEYVPEDTSAQAEVDSGAEVQSGEDSTPTEAAPTTDRSDNDTTGDETVAGDDDPLTFTASEIAASPAPLDDFSQEEDLTEITAGSADTVSFTLPQDSGTLYVLPADYSETASSETGEASYVYSGFNVYYVPEGQSFPAEYDWSEEGATLYNGETYQQDDTDFGDIRMVARIDSGYTVTETDFEAGTAQVQDHALGTPEIEANCRIIWA
ncbi:hypothetical protein Q4543_23195 [Salipiger sp. 1_MG-2023]|uniref:hypothetical protein n=1 Tax=Salipiger sp. 1_MG-2023 TaxID=3062665 RepID=UPI0026E44A15|nr:hypothetical protein [Salipiger sp. 1_MG-2023]MDO6588400.1 hypothetical protein [Salipiger sp. 1_MG-2023]